MSHRNLLGVILCCTAMLLDGQTARAEGVTAQQIISEEGTLCAVIGGWPIRRGKPNSAFNLDGEVLERLQRSFSDREKELIDNHEAEIGMSWCALRASWGWPLISSSRAGARDGAENPRVEHRYSCSSAKGFELPHCPATKVVVEYGKVTAITE